MKTRYSLLLLRIFRVLRFIAISAVPGFIRTGGWDPAGSSGRLARRLTVYWSHVFYARANLIQPDFAAYFTAFATFAMLRKV